MSQCSHINKLVREFSKVLCDLSSPRRMLVALTSLLLLYCICTGRRRRLLTKFPLLRLFQSSNNSCSILEAAKHQDIGLPRAFSFCYQQEIESTKQTLGSRNKALPEQVWIKVGGKPPSGREQALLPDLCPPVLVVLEGAVVYEHDQSWKCLYLRASIFPRHLTFRFAGITGIILTLGMETLSAGLPVLNSKYPRQKRQT